MKALDDYNAEMARIKGAADLTSLQKAQAISSAQSAATQALQGKTLALTGKVTDVAEGGYRRKGSYAAGSNISLREVTLKTTTGGLTISLTRWESVYDRPDSSETDLGIGSIAINDTGAAAAAIPKDAEVSIRAMTSGAGQPSHWLYISDHGSVQIKISDVRINGKALGLLD